MRHLADSLLRQPLPLRRAWRSEGGATSVEFVIVFPLMFTIFLASVDFGVTMLRQVMLDRAVDSAIREVRLGRISSDGSTQLSDLICQRSALLGNCSANIAVEMQRMEPESPVGLNAPFQCINEEQEITPALNFNAGASHDLMIIRVCVTANPLIRLTGWFTGLPINESGDYQLTARGVFVNEPRNQ